MDSVSWCLNERWSIVKELHSGKARATGTERACNLVVNGEEICVYPLDGLMDELGKRWTLLVIGALGDGATRFNGIMSELHGISPRTLSQRLKSLEALGLIRRRVIAETPPRVEYALTCKGRNLLGALHPLLRWAAENATGP